jgi:hypothetical protein
MNNIIFREIFLGNNGLQNICNVIQRNERTLSILNL